MDLKPIRTEEDHRVASREASEFFDHGPDPGTPAGDRFEILLMLLDDYERRHHPITPPDPVEAIKFRMAQSGLTAKDLTPMIGKLNRVYEILSYKRPLTLAMICRLHRDLHIPAESLDLSKTDQRDRRCWQRLKAKHRWFRKCSAAGYMAQEDENLANKRHDMSGAISPAINTLNQT